MKNASRAHKTGNAVFDTIRLLEKAHIHFSIKRNRPDAVTFVAAIVGERIEIDVFEDDQIEITRFRSNEDIEGGRELLVQIVMAELRDNYPGELPDLAAR